MKYLVFILLIFSLSAGCTTISSNAVKQEQSNDLKQQLGCILFSQGSSDDFDLYIQDALASLGLTAEISYENACPANADWIISYEDRTGWDMVLYLDELTISMRDQHSEEPIASSQFKSLPLLHSFPDSRKVAFELVYDMFNRDLDYSAFKKGKPKISFGKGWNISIAKHKMAQNVYVLRANGAGARSLESVQEIIFLHARQIANGRSFYYYFSNSKYNYTSSGSLFPFSYEGEQVIALIEIIDELDGMEYALDAPSEAMQVAGSPFFVKGVKWTE